MNRTPEVSIITPTYNRQQSLERAIRSVQQQTFDNYEHIIIDDCSTDDTQKFVWSLDDPRIRYIRFREWRGANPARNCGIGTARAEYLTFLDSDDEYLPERLETTLRHFREAPDVQLLLSSFHTVKRGRFANAINAGVYVSGPDLEHALMASAIYIAGSSISVKRETM
ncbi:MAG: glycosyltransferase family 2 protein [Planctomycetota bacterium]|nr:glycosyltransferase family 2 protein [Planctomycetota bacterium]MDA1179976.1 glycosyltransferase family 2 protein [Planctomycetota bacterium]